MNLKQKWYALPEWKRAVLSLAIIPLLPIIAVSIIVVYVVAVLLSGAMSCVEDALDIIYKDKP
jgi:fructose-specific phosphotransferase system IIC component